MNSEGQIPPLVLHALFHVACCLRHWCRGFSQPSTRTADLGCCRPSARARSRLRADNVNADCQLLLGGWLRQAGPGATGRRPAAGGDEPHERGGGGLRFQKRFALGLLGCWGRSTWARIGRLTRSTAHPSKGCLWEVVGFLAEAFLACSAFWESVALLGLRPKKPCLVKPQFECW